MCVCVCSGIATVVGHRRGHVCERGTARWIIAPHGIDLVVPFRWNKMEIWSEIVLNRFITEIFLFRMGFHFWEGRTEQPLKSQRFYSAGHRGNLRILIVIHLRAAPCARAINVNTSEKGWNHSINASFCVRFPNGDDARKLIFFILVPCPKPKQTLHVRCVDAWLFSIWRPVSVFIVHWKTAIYSFY